MPELLTPEERAIIHDLGSIWDRIVKVVGNNNIGDLDEIGQPLHEIQCRIMSIAAARAYPDEFRKLGEKQIRA